MKRERTCTEEVTTNIVERGRRVKLLRILLGVILLVNGFNGCITQEDTYFGDSKNDFIQPELSDEEFIDLINDIVLEKVSLEMFDVYNGSLMNIRNTYDCNNTEIRVVIRRSATDVYISVSPGHFGKLSGFPEMIDTRGLFAPQIEKLIAMEENNEAYCTASKKTDRNFFIYFLFKTRTATRIRPATPATRTASLEDDCPRQ